MIPQFDLLPLPFCFLIPANEMTDYRQGCRENSQVHTGIVLCAHTSPCLRRSAGLSMLMSGVLLQEPINEFACNNQFERKTKDGGGLDV